MAAAKHLWPAGEKPTSYLVHGDYWAGNTLWKNEKLVAIVDWEEPRNGESTFDITDLVQDAAFSGIDIEQSAIDQYERVSGRSPRDRKFWSMVGAMPNPGEWAAGLHLTVGVTITPEEVNLNLTSSVNRLLADSWPGRFLESWSLGGGGADSGARMVGPRKNQTQLAIHPFGLMTSFTPLPSPESTIATATSSSA
jgi:Ser/Thr protein kinase RdoA (MazF antagonist)